MKTSFKFFYLNDLYVQGNRKVLLPFTHVLGKFDRKVLDKLIDNLAIVHVVVAYVIAWFDKYIVDGVIKFKVFFWRSLAKYFKSTQETNVQSYLMGFVVFLFLIGFWVVSYF